MVLSEKTAPAQSGRIRALLVAIGTLLLCGIVSTQEVQSKPKGDAHKKQKPESDNLIRGRKLQVTQMTFGNYEVIITDRFARTKTPVIMGLHSPPYEKVYFVSNETKAYCVWDVKNEPYPHGRAMGNPIPRCHTYKKIGTGKWLGITCDIVYGFKKDKTLVARYYMTRSIKVPLSLTLGYEGSVNSPSKYGFPLHAALKVGRAWQPIYITRSIEKGHFKRSIFEFPKQKYKKVDTMTALLFSSGSGKFGIEDLFEHHFNDK